MFLDNTEYPFMVVVYKSETFILIAKRNIKKIKLDMNFLAIGKVISIEGDKNTLASRLNSLMNSTTSAEKERWFQRKQVAIEVYGLFIQFNNKYKEEVMDFFKKIPFFIS